MGCGVAADDESTATRVLFVSTNRGLGGQPQSLLTLLEHLPSTVVARVAAPRGAVTERAAHLPQVEHVTVLPYDVGRPRWSRLREAVVIAREGWSQRRHLDAIHANGQSELNLVALATLLSRVPVVMWAHAVESSPTAGWLRPLWRLLMRRVTWTAVSRTAATTLASAIGTAVDQIRVVPNPVDPARVVAAPRSHDGVRIAYLGQPFEIKGFPLLGSIIEHVERDGVAFDLFLAPPPANLPLELRPPWDALFAAAEGRQVFLFGQQSDVRPIYGETDIVLCPSRNESFNRIAVEAMMNGIPVVATDLPAHRALLGEEEAGLLFPVGDAVAGAAAVTRLVDHPELRQRLGARGRERAQAYLPELIIPMLVAAYRGG